MSGAEGWEAIGGMCGRCRGLGGGRGQVWTVQRAGRWQGAGVSGAEGWEAIGGRCEGCRGLGGGRGQV